MKLRISYAIVFLVISMTGVPAWHQIGSFASLDTCKKAVEAAEEQMGFSPVYPSGKSITEIGATWGPIASLTVSANAPGACLVNAPVGTTKVEFFMDGQPLPADSTPLAEPWTCNLDTTKFADGNHTMRADVYDAAGVKTEIFRKITIRNTTVALPELPKPALVHAGCVQKT